MGEPSPSEQRPEEVPSAEAPKPSGVERPALPETPALTETPALPRPSDGEPPGGTGGTGGERDRPEGAPQAEREEVLSDDATAAGSFHDQMAADERERDLREESLRDLRGNRTRIKGDHNTAWNAGRDINNNNFSFNADQKRRAQCPRITAYEAHRLVTCVTDVDAIVDQIVGTLNRHRVALVRGHSGSGRMATAMLALLRAELLGDSWADVTEGRHDQQVNVAHLLLRDEPLELRHEDIEDGIGYVLDATDETWPRHGAGNVVDHLADIAANCRIVVLVGEDCLLSERTINQVTPHAETVFANHLEYMLKYQASGMRDPAIWVDKIRSCSELKTALGESPTPRIAVDTAAEVFHAYEAYGPDQQIEVYLSGLPTLLLKEMQGKLHADRASLRSRCFAIAAAVLNTLSAVTVSRAALDLVALVENRGQDEAAVTTPSWEQLSEWLEFAGATAPPSTRGEGRVVQLNRTAQVHATLEAVWEDHPTVRESLILWLKRLSEHPDQAVRIKVAHTVGTLATFDFDVIEREFLRPWAKSNRIRHHQLASWVLEAAVTYDAISDRVRKLLRRWGNGSRTQQSVAARAYGSAIGTLWVDDTLNAFETISKVVRLPRLQDAVARSLADLFGEGREMSILRKLYRWSDDAYPSQRRTAALTFNRLASRLESEEGRIGMVELLARDDPDLLRLMTGLWWNALSGGVMLTHRRSLRAGDNAGWDIIADWLRREAAHPVLAPVIDGVFELNGEYAGLKRPLSMHLQWWFHRNPKIIGRERAQRLAGLLESN